MTKIPGRMIAANTVATTNLAREGTTDQVLTSNGALADPAYEASLTQADVIALIEAQVPILGVPGTRQCALFGPVTSGQPSFLPASAVGLTLTSQSLTSTSLVVNFANGLESYTATITTNLAWTGLTDATTNYLYIDVVPSTGVITTGSTTIAPDYRYDTTYSTSNQQATFSIPEMVMKVGNGVSAVQTYRVYLGEAVTSGGNVTSTVAYAYQGEYYSGAVAVPAATNLTTFNHNIGVTDVIVDWMIKNVTAQHGYTTGQSTRFANDSTGNDQIPPGNCATRNTVTNITANFYVISNATTGAIAAITPANWTYHVYVRRPW